MTVMKGVAGAALGWLADQQPAMIALLREIVSIDSGSYNKRGAGAAIRRFLEEQGVMVETLPQKKHGDCLRALVGVLANGTSAAANARTNIVLMGHRDTVFPDGEAARRPFRVADGLAFGPGVADMKAGLVMNCFVLAAFARAGGAPAPLVGLFTADEEVGSPEGRPVIEAEARRARAVFNSEPGRLSGKVVSGRKGGIFMQLRVVGKAAHSGANFGDGVSAIEELAQKIIALHALTDIPRGVTLNVGLVSGGQSVNTVAPNAEAAIDFRYKEPLDRDPVLGRIHAIVARSFVPGTRAELVLQGEFLPLVETAPSRRLLELYRKAASETGFATSAAFTGGCADSGFTAAVGAPTLCSVGPIGARAHTPEEFLRLESLIPRSQALVRAVCAVAASGP